MNVYGFCIPESVIDSWLTRCPTKLARWIYMNLHLINYRGVFEFHGSDFITNALNYTDAVPFV